VFIITRRAFRVGIKKALLFVVVVVVVVLKKKKKNIFLLFTRAENIFEEEGGAPI
jgi:hypothetical protein